MDVTLNLVQQYYKAPTSDIFFFHPNVSNVEKHVTDNKTSTYFHLRNIAKIRPIHSTADAETFVHAFISARLVYGNTLPSGSPTSSINKLQFVQITAAMILT